MKLFLLIEAQTMRSNLREREDAKTHRIYREHRKQGRALPCEAAQSFYFYIILAFF